MNRSIIAILAAPAAALALTGCATDPADAISQATGSTQTDVLVAAAEECNPAHLGHDDETYSVEMSAEEVEAPEQDAAPMSDMGCVLAHLDVPSSVLNAMESSASLAGMGEAHTESWTDDDGHEWTLDWTLDLASGISVDLSMGGEA